MRFLLYLSGVGLGTLVACDVQPCDRYVDYICVCHDQDPEFDCQELIDVLTDADPDVQDQCAIDLSDQQAQDAADGLECTN